MKRFLCVIAFLSMLVFFAPTRPGFASDTVTMAPGDYLQIVFNKPVALGGDTANAFYLDSSKGKIPVVVRLHFIGTVAGGEKGSYNKFWLEPLQPLEEGVEYQLTINNSLRAADGAVMSQPFTTNIIVVGKAAEPEPPTDPDADGLSRRTPAGLNKTVRAVWSDYKGGYTADITLKEIIRGDEAWRLIKEENKYNDPPAEGYEYVLTKIDFHYLTGPDIDARYNVYKYNFTAVSASGRDYKYASVVVPSPELDAYLYPGASYEGWAVCQVEKTDAKPLLTFARDYSGIGGVWFRLY